MIALFDILFGCPHSRYTWPQKNKETGETTVSCLECGKTISYDFESLGGEEEIVAPRTTAPRVHVIDSPETAVAYMEG